MTRTCGVAHISSEGMTSEPLFVRKPGAAGSCLMSMTRNGTSAIVVILDAQDFAREPIAMIRPVRVPFGFHGDWAPDKVTEVE